MSEKSRGIERRVCVGIVVFGMGESKTRRTVILKDVSGMEFDALVGIIPRDAYRVVCRLKQFWPDGLSMAPVDHIR